LLTSTSVTLHIHISVRRLGGVGVVLSSPKVGNQRLERPLADRESFELLVQDRKCVNLVVGIGGSLGGVIINRLSVDKVDGLGGDRLAVDGLGGCLLRPGVGVGGLPGVGMGMGMAMGPLPVHVHVVGSLSLFAPERLVAVVFVLEDVLPPRIGFATGFLLGVPLSKEIFEEGVLVGIDFFLFQQVRKPFLVVLLLEQFL